MRINWVVTSVGVALALALGSTSAISEEHQHGIQLSPAAPAYETTAQTAGSIDLHLHPAEHVSAGKQGEFRINIHAEASDEVLFVDADGVVTPPKGKRIVISLPGRGKKAVADIDKDGYWEAGIEIPLQGSPAPKKVDVKVLLEQKGAKQPLLRWKTTAEVSYAPLPQPIPDEFFSQIDPARQAALSQDATAFTFAVNNEGFPVRWDPCTPIRVVVDPTGLHSDAMSDVQRAFDELSAASGLTFMPIEVVDNLPAVNEQGRIPRIPGAITVTTATPDDIPALAGATLGLGGVTYLGERVHEGYVSIDVSDSPVPGFQDSNSLGRILLHELGHAINLGHVENPGQIMNPELLTGGPEGYQAGDRAGMLALTGGGCTSG